jgi:hypothetical protein
MTAMKSKTHQALDQVILAKLNIKPDDFSNLIMSYLRDDDFIEERTKYHHDVVMVDLIGCDKSLKNYYNYEIEEEIEQYLEIFDIEEMEEYGMDVGQLIDINNNVRKRSKIMNNRAVLHPNRSKMNIDTTYLIDCIPNCGYTEYFNYVSNDDDISDCDDDIFELDFE